MKMKHCFIMTPLFSSLCMKREEQQVLIGFFPCSSTFCSVSSQSCSRAQSALVPPHKVLPLTSSLAALHWIVPVPRPTLRAEREAEASRAVADLKQAVGTEEGFSLASSQVVDCLQVVINRDVTQLLPPLQPPPPPQKDNTWHQNQHQDGQNTGDSDSSGGGLRGLAQSGLETRLKRELTTWTHEAFRALAYRPGEVGEASPTILAWTGTAGIWAYSAVLAGEPQGAGACVIIYTILAGSGILAGVWGAVIDVDLAVGTSEACLTAAQDALAEVQTLTTCRREKYSVKHPNDLGYLFNSMLIGLNHQLCGVWCWQVISTETTSCSNFLFQPLDVASGWVSFLLTYRLDRACCCSGPTSSHSWSPCSSEGTGRCSLRSSSPHRCHRWSKDHLRMSWRWSRSSYRRIPAGRCRSSRSLGPVEGGRKKNLF